MKCIIKEVNWNGIKEYYCTTHRSLASKNGIKLKERISNNKEAFGNIVKMNKEEIKEICLIYPNLIESTKGTILVNGKIIGILQIDDSIYEVRDFGGLLLSLLNDVEFEVEKCPLCGHIHSDDGQFAFRPHNPHLCMYCGNLFEVKKANIGNELNTIFNIPKINLKEDIEVISDKLELKYDILKGIVTINGNIINKIILNKEELLLKDYLNKRLYNEY